MAENKDSKTIYNVDTKHCKYVLIGENISVNVYPKEDGEPQLLAVRPVKKEPSDTRKANEETNKNSSVLEVSKDKTYPGVFETETDTNGSRHGLEGSIIKLGKWVRQFGSKRGSDSNDEEMQSQSSGTNSSFSGSWPRIDLTSDKTTNASHTGSLPIILPTSDEMCHLCIIKSKTRLPQDRDKWPISQIEKNCFQLICQSLDVDCLNKKPLLRALGLPQNEATKIIQECMATQGESTAKKALDVWGTSLRKNNNVGALKKIIKRKMKRDDVFAVITKWEELPVCHGCGTLLQRELQKDQINRYNNPPN